MPIEKHGSYRAMIERFDNVPAFVAAMRKEKGISAGQTSGGYSAANSDRSWSGADDLAGALNDCEQGNCGSALQDAEKLMHEIQAQGLMSEHVMRWGPNVVGAIPLIPNALLGVPDSMLAPLWEAQSARGPIKVFYDCVGSAGVSETDMSKRGTAVLAFVLLMSQIRPVELFVIAGMQGTGGACIPIVKVETAPLDLKSSLYALARTAYSREIAFAWGYSSDAAGTRRGFHGGWAWGSAPQQDGTGVWHEAMRTVLDIQPDDLLIPGAVYGDPIVKDPITWLQREIDKRASHE